MKIQKGTPPSLWKQTYRRLLHHKLTVISLLFLCFMFLLCFIGPSFSPYITDRTDISNANQHPGIHHWLGTDQYGRDVLTRLMLAGQISLTVGLASMVLSLVIGSLLGAAAGFYRGAADMIIMRIADMLMSIPGLPLLLILAAVMSEWKVPSEYRMYLIMMMLSLIGWPSLARLVRGQILSLKEQPFMMAAEVLGLSDRRKILYHLLPNTLPLLLVAATLHVAGAMLSESALSFLGLGVAPPTPSWGNMMEAANNFMDFTLRPWLWIPPGTAIFLTVVAIHLLGDGLRDAFDPKVKRQVKVK
ncbi:MULTISPECIES: oligopeptide ABC transporter permease [Bacillus]|jgi:peptide/nickel transport system permease protein|uniref:Oligopeptide transport system permease protein oppC Stage 0 sporulation protein KC n=1 Tax=Bacillus amyloliquefaciens (strain ATCC 23350 / DSM 7 / BCRC 11601 / CCUG 28519 / NBRC 15535 / NRRL B-14393 / F) TaxID=692420 RepID=A0A9P1NH88_BACAS|nr:oligopeptide ABC transporter permease [Bacillus amyloliquefaciens]AIW32872.1 peptide ABC transporter permease [Bacillus subtilis]AEB22996.1 oligopeptide ABC transporter, permease protein [Bacillus amyloliquefaciens TA208]AEB62498.1 Oligopeptide transport system permease protein oppC Stage 0 sporulation protein KC [Bacillus amyloliquefaciens LL3]AEK87992.1 oligopeptide ABC transporter, permease protein [Bacillus amyloliquefaciens XH7]ARW38126.1 Dipeptide transport system permease protein Dpp